MFDWRPERRERFSQYRVCADFFRTENEHMFEKKGVRRITPDERKFALCFARTLSVKRSCAAAGFDSRTSFARASRLLERDDVQALVHTELLRDNAATAPCGTPGVTDDVPVPSSRNSVRKTRGECHECPLPPEDMSYGTFSTSTVADTGALSTKCTPGESGTAYTTDNAEVCGTDRGEPAYDFIEERILREYERIAFADAESGEVKIADKLRALEQYRAIAAARHSRNEGALSLTVNYDYGDADE